MPTVIGQQRNSFRDASGKVLIAVYENPGNPEQQIWDQQINPSDPKSVAIGGGGTATDGSVNTLTPGPGALLTASRPSPAKGEGWIIQSRSHLSDQAYSLHTY